MHCHTAGDIFEKTLLLSGCDSMFVSDRCSSGAFPTFTCCGFAVAWAGPMQGKKICPSFITGGGRIFRQSHGSAHPAHMARGFGNDSYELM